MSPRSAIASTRAAVLVLLTGCSPPPPAPPVSPSAAPRPPPRMQAPPPEVRARVSLPDTTGVLWRSARAGDPLDAARLASAVGAAALLDVARAENDASDTALAALAFAEDGEVVLGALGEIAERPSPRRRLVLLAIRGIAERLHPARERLDPEGARASGIVVVAIARDPRADPEDRRVADAAARALAEHGDVDPRSLP